MPEHFDVRPYSFDSLRAILVGGSHGANAAVGDKPQVRFLNRYLTHLGCKSIVVEADYTDRNFLEDYAAYYVRCFEPYARVCIRLHFFNAEIDTDLMSKAVLGTGSVPLQDSYLGFVVVKPLPLTVIGRTCLVPFGQESGRLRAFPPVKIQELDLYGVKLSVETLPFQEQDREVAACASSALWTMLHSTSRLFQHAMPSPVEITKAATAHARVDGRTFPNGEGLNTLQIADAIRSVGLEPFGIGVNSVERHKVVREEFADGEGEGAATSATGSETREERADRMQLELKIAVLAYLRSGIACALLARTTDQVGPEMIVRGNHAVAITGYCLRDAPPTASPLRSGTRFAAARLDRLYVHDDQTGPFTSFLFEAANMLAADDFSAPEVTRRLAEPINLIVPLYHKIRIPLSQVVELTVAFDAAFELMRASLGVKERLEWDIELVPLEAQRDDIVDSSLTDNLKLELLTQPLPRFVWRVRAVLKTKRVFDLLLDATDLLQGDLVRHLLPHDRLLCRRIAMLMALPTGWAPTLRPTIKAFAEFRKRD